MYTEYYSVTKQNKRIHAHTTQHNAPPALLPYGCILPLCLVSSLLSGVLIVIAELQFVRLLDWFSFLCTLIGLGGFYIFVGGLALGDEWYAITIGQHTLTHTHIPAQCARLTRVSLTYINVHVCLFVCVCLLLAVVLVCIGLFYCIAGLGCNDDRATAVDLKQGGSGAPATSAGPTATTQNNRPQTTQQKQPAPSSWPNMDEEAI